jgi:hypothetical protein
MASQQGQLDGTSQDSQQFGLGAQFECADDPDERWSLQHYEQKKADGFRAHSAGQVND